MNPQPLPARLRKNACEYTLVPRGTRSAVYAQRITPEIEYYEVFELRIQPAKMLPSGKSYPAKERFPSNEDFGGWAWSCRTLERTMERFKELENVY